MHGLLVDDGALLAGITATPGPTNVGSGLLYRTSSEGNTRSSSFRMGTGPLPGSSAVQGRSWTLAKAR